MVARHCGAACCDAGGEEDRQPVILLPTPDPKNRMAPAMELVR